jgi:hypothetical protein
MKRKQPHIVVEIRFVGHGFQLDAYDWTLATQDGQGIKHLTECHDFSVARPIADSAEMAMYAIAKAMRSIP